MAATKEGTTLQAQATSFEADGVSGQATLRWRGTVTELNTLIGTLGLATSGHRYSIEPDSDVPEIGTLTWIIATGADGSTTETDDPVSTDWQLDTPSEIVPLSEHPDWVSEMALFAVADPDGYDLFLSYWEGSATFDDIAAESIDDEIESDYPFIWQAIQDKRQGVRGYFRGAPTLTVVDRYQRQAPNAADTAEVNIVYTKAQLVTALGSRPAGEQIPSDISNNLADGEWLCEAVSRRSASDGAREVTQVFRWAPKWKDHLYEHAT